MPGFDSGVEGSHDTDDKGNKTVPLTALIGVKDELKDTKEQNQLLKDQVDLYKANMPTNDPNDDKNADDKLNDGDVITVGEVKQLIASQAQPFAAALKQLEVGQTKTDFVDTINTYLPEVLKEDPELVQAIKSSGNPALLAYKLAKSSPGYIKAQEEAKLSGKDGDKGDGDLSDAEKLKLNQEKPGGTSGAGGSGGGASSGEFYQNMSDDDLEKHIASVQRQG